LARCSDAAAADEAHVFKLAVAQVAVEILSLRVACIDLGAVHLGIDVAVGDKNVEPAVVVDVDEADAPAQQARVDAKACLVGAVVEGAVAEIHIEGIGVAGEVCFHNVEQPSRL
jgi:hypothetical protein